MNFARAQRWHPLRLLVVAMVIVCESILNSWRAAAPQAGGNQVKNDLRPALFPSVGRISNTNGQIIAPPLAGLVISASGAAV